MRPVFAQATDSGVHQHVDGGGVFSAAASGGLSWAMPQALLVLDAAGYDIVVLETVGVDQAEVDVASTDTTVVTLGPGPRDAMQAAKAGSSRWPMSSVSTKPTAASSTEARTKQQRATLPAGADRRGIQPGEGAGQLVELARRLRLVFAAQQLQHRWPKMD